MFRELSRKKQQMTFKECIELLKTENRGVLSVLGDNGYPYGMPMNHFYDESDGKIYFHCGKTGHRADALKANPKVSFCVFDQGFRREDEWALNVKSVIVFGKIELIEDIKTITEITTKLSYKFTQDAEYIEKEINSAANKTLLLSLSIDYICGKLVNEA